MSREGSLKEGSSIDVPSPDIQRSPSVLTYTEEDFAKLRLPYKITVAFDCDNLFKNVFILTKTCLRTGETQQFKRNNDDFQKVREYVSEDKNLTGNLAPPLADLKQLDRQLIPKNQRILLGKAIHTYPEFNLFTRAIATNENFSLLSMIKSFLNGETFEYPEIDKREGPSPRLRKRFAFIKIIPRSDWHYRFDDPNAFFRRYLSIEKSKTPALSQVQVTFGEFVKSKKDTDRCLSTISGTIKLIMVQDEPQESLATFARYIEEVIEELKTTYLTETAAHYHSLCAQLQWFSEYQSNYKQLLFDRIDRFVEYQRINRERVACLSTNEAHKKIYDEVISHQKYQDLANKVRYNVLHYNWFYQKELMRALKIYKDQQIKLSRHLINQLKLYIVEAKRR